MTLNIGAVGPSGLHMGSDLRMSQLQGGKQLRYQDDALKMVQASFIKRDWSCIVAFNGIGALNGVRTEDWLARTIVSAGAECSINDVVYAIRDKAKEFVSPAPDRRHSFLMGLCAGGALRLIAISNYESLRKPPLAAARSDFDVSRYTFESGRSAESFVRVFGAISAVAQSQVDALAALVASETDPQKVRRAIAALIDSASGSGTAAARLISSNCLVFSLYPGGQGNGFAFPGPAPVTMRVVMSGIDTSEMMMQALQKLMPGQIPRLVQSAFISTRSKT